MGWFIDTFTLLFAMIILANFLFSGYRFGHLACFTSDVEVFLQALDSNKKSEFLKNLVKEHEATTIAPTKALGQSITKFKVQNLIGNVFALPVDGMPYAMSFDDFIWSAVSFLLNFYLLPFNHISCLFYCLNGSLSSKK